MVNNSYDKYGEVVAAYSRALELVDALDDVLNGLLEDFDVDYIKLLECMALMYDILKHLYNVVEMMEIDMSFE
jgi:hypothetical protein